MPHRTRCVLAVLAASALSASPAPADAPPDVKAWRFGGPSQQPASGDVRIRAVDGPGPVRDPLRVTVSAKGSAKWETLFDGNPDAEGRALVAGIAPGSAVVAITVGRFRRSVSFQVVAGKAIEIETVLPRGPAVDGELRHASSGPLPGVHLNLEEAGPSTGWMDTMTADTDEKGHYRLPELPASRWLVSMRGGALGREDRIRAVIHASGTAPLTRDLLVGRVNLKGTVRDASAKRPVEGARVVVHELHFVTKTTATGEYAFEDVPPGKYKLLVSADGLGERFVETGAVPEPGAAPLSLDVSLQPAATIVLTLKDRSDRPLSGSFWLDFQVVGSGSGTASQLKADENGECVFPRGVPGRYRIGVRMDGWKSEPQDVTLKAGKNELRFVLSRT